jgi:hypothetical protein
MDRSSFQFSIFHLEEVDVMDEFVANKNKEFEDYCYEIVRQHIEAIDSTERFVNICVRVSRRLHKSGIVRQKFGKEIPVIIHELEYYDQIAQQTSAANPAGLADEFVDWVLNLGD